MNHHNTVDATGWKHEDFESWWLDYEMPSGGHRPYEKLGSVTTGTLCEWAFNAGRATLPPPPGTDTIYQDETRADRAALTSAIAAAEEREEALRAENAELKAIMRGAVDLITEAFAEHKSEKIAVAQDRIRTALTTKGGEDD